MAQKKPVTVLIFDLLFWCAFILEAAAIIEYVRNPGPEMASIRIAISSSFCFLSSLILWYLASVQRVFIAVGLIGASIIVKMSLYIQLPSLYWESFTWLALHIAPLFLLGLSIACMATPSAAYWRRHEHELTQQIFE